MNHRTTIILNHIGRLDVEFVILVNRIEPFPRAANHHAHTIHNQTFGEDFVGDDKARITAAVHECPDVLGASFKNVIQIGPHQKVVCGEFK